MMAGWVGGSFVNRDKKGDPGDRNPVEVVPAAQQRAALNFIIETTFLDEAFGLTPELLAKMTSDMWFDEGPAPSAEAAWPIHDRILGVQSSALTMLMNPTTLRRVYDNEFRIPADADMLTLPELLSTVTNAAWTELAGECPAEANPRKPMISSFRRNLQHEHLDRLIDLVVKPSGSAAALKPIRNLATMQLRGLKGRIDEAITKCQGKLDPYTEAHLVDSQQRIDRALNAAYTIGGNQAASLPPMIMFGKEAAAPTASQE